MDIFILRHGNAEPAITSDKARPLSAKGELDVHAVCQANYEALKNVQHVFVSPYLRAQQSADIASQYLSAQTTESNLLSPNGNPGEVITYLYNLSKQYQSILLVSHQPLVGTLVDDLGGFELGRYRMGTSALAYFSCDPVAVDCCKLNWLKRP